MFTFPTHLFNPAAIKLRLAGSTIEGGEALSGESDVVRTDGGGYWMVTLSGVDLRSPDLIRAWRAWEDHLEDGVTRCLVPVADVRQAPRPIAGARLASPSALVGDDDNPYFPEAIAFATPFIVATVVNAADLRATTLTMNVERGARLQGGEIFALEHPTVGRRIYRTGRVTSRSGQTAVVTIRPPLREAITAGIVADFDWPSLVAAQVPRLDISPDIAYGRQATVDVVFREAF